MGEFDICKYMEFIVKVSYIKERTMLKYKVQSNLYSVSNTMG